MAIWPYGTWTSVGPNAEAIESCLAGHIEKGTSIAAQLHGWYLL